MGVLHICMRRHYVVEIPSLLLMKVGAWVAMRTDIKWKRRGPRKPYMKILQARCGQEHYALNKSPVNAQRKSLMDVPVYS